MDRSGSLYVSSAAAAFDYAHKMGAHIISCSFGPDAPVLGEQPMTSWATTLAMMAQVCGRRVPCAVRCGTLRS